MCALISFLEAHPGHQNLLGEVIPNSYDWRFWLEKIGKWHFILIHFPIALINLTLVAEVCNLKFKNILFDHASRFMLTSAAILIVPTVLCGLALSYGQKYEGVQLELFEAHRFFGLLTCLLTVWTAFIKQRNSRLENPSFVLFYVALFLSFVSVNLTGTLGGNLTFGL